MSQSNHFSPITLTVLTLTDLIKLESINLTYFHTYMHSNDYQNAALIQQELHKIELEINKRNRTSKQLTLTNKH